MSDVAIRAEGLGKLYRIGARKEDYYTLRDTLAQTVTRPFQKLSSLFSRNDSGAAAAHPPTIWALKDVSFEVNRGEVVGIIGRNGAGKSTLLKIFSRITEPTEGWAEIHGRVGSLLEVGTGFHPELTGRENIYLNGAVLGMRKNETHRKFDEIVAFAEMGKFIDTPVKRYSSGMYVRLAFAVAAHLEPEILLVDEVLAVGDIDFQKKCLGKMQEVSNTGRTILFVSHNLTVVEALCSKSLLLADGRLQIFADTQSAVSAYVSRAFNQSTSLLDRQDRKGNRALLVSAVRIYGPLTPQGGVRSGATTYFDVHYLNNTHDEQKAIYVFIGLYDSFGRRVSLLANKYLNAPLVAHAEAGLFRCVVDKLPLTPGKYYLNVIITKPHVRCDSIEQACGFTVDEGDFFGTGQKGDTHSRGGVFIQHNWQHAP